MSTRFVLILASWTLLAACQKQKSVETTFDIHSFKDRAVAVRDAQASPTLPFKSYRGTILVELTINQSGPLKFVIDTGAANTSVFVSSRTAGFDQGGHLAYPDSPYVEGVNLTIGNLTLQNHTVQKMPPSFFGLESFESFPFDGLIGYDLLRFVTLEIDRKGKLIHLHDPNQHELSERWKSTELDIHEYKAYCMAHVQVNADDDPVEARFHLDMGMTDFLILAPSPNSGLTTPKADPKPMGMVNGHSMTGIVSTIHAIQLLGFTRRNVETKFIIDGFPSDNERAGSIGARLLNKHDLLIDYAHGILAAKSISADN